MTTAASLDLSQLSSWLRYAKITCEQVVTDSLSAIAADPQSPEIFTHIASETALTEARALDAAGAVRNALKPLAGVPFVVQDMIAVDGQPDSAGTAIDLATLMPRQGPLVKKLREMGAIATAKTVASEFSFSFHNLARSLPANPHYKDEAYTIGGSAAALAIAQKLSRFALAPDSASTLRASASMCGVTGFRPSNDFWSRDGMFSLSRELDSIGLIAPTAKDLTFLLEMLGGGTLPDMAAAKLRLGVAQKAFYENLDPAVAQAMTRTLETLSKKGATLVPIVMPDYEQLKSFNLVANGTGLVRHIGRDRIQGALGQMDPVTQIRIKPGMDADISEIQRLFEARRILVNRVNSNLAHIDALIMPTLTGLPVPVSSFTDAQSVVAWQEKLTHNIAFAGLFNMTAITIPIPGPQPIGLQLVAPAGSEVKLAALAHSVQQTLAAAG
jgi:aspartyl-tRNA(Asn)/glutamyl-tRNA(Gln) amidotransferase subunit A